MTNKFRITYEDLPKFNVSKEPINYIISETGRWALRNARELHQALTIAAAAQDYAETLRGLDKAGTPTNISRNGFPANYVIDKAGFIAVAWDARPAIKKIVEAMGGD